MKYLFLFFIVILFSFKVFSQLSYNDLSDLNIICKKGDFEAAKIFLKTKDYSIDIFKNDYDHGSYFVLGEIEAKKKIGNKYQKYLIGTDFDNIYDEIKIKFNEYNDKKELEITQHYSTNNVLHVSYSKLAPVYEWITKKWTSVLIDDYDMANEIFPDKKDTHISLGSYYGGIDNGLKKIDEKLLSSYFYNHKFKEAETFRLVFRNENLNYGDWTNYYVSYEYTNFSKDSTYEEAKNKSYVYHITLNTAFAKGGDLINKVEKKITFPLIKEGKIYSVRLKFGTISKSIFWILVLRT